MEEALEEAEEEDEEWVASQAAAKDPYYEIVELQWMVDTLKRDKDSWRLAELAAVGDWRDRRHKEYVDAYWAWAKKQDRMTQEERDRADDEQEDAVIALIATRRAKRHASRQEQEERERRGQQERRERRWQEEEREDEERKRLLALMSPEERQEQEEREQREQQEERERRWQERQERERQERQEQRDVDLVVNVYMVGTATGSKRGLEEDLTAEAAAEGGQNKKQCI